MPPSVAAVLCIYGLIALGVAYCLGRYHGERDGAAARAEEGARLDAWARRYEAHVRARYEDELRAALAESMASYRRGVSS